MAVKMNLCSPTLVAGKPGFYRCAFCGWTNRHPLAKPYRRNCGQAPPVNSVRSQYELDYLATTFCCNCKWFDITERCIFDRGCRQAKTSEQWRQKAARVGYTCPVGKWNPHVDVLYGINPANQEWVESKARVPVELLNAGGVSAALCPAHGVSIKSISAAIARQTPRLFVNCAMFLSADHVARLAIEFPNTRFLTTCHSSQSDLARVESWLLRQLTFLDLVDRLDNCWYGLVDERPYVLGAFGRSRVVHLGNCAPATQHAAGGGLHDPPTVSLICEWRALKNVPNQLLAMALVNQVRPIRPILALKNDQTGKGQEMARSLGLTADVRPWQSWQDYRRMIAAEIDVGLQASFTESFNFVALDHLQADKTVIGSPAIRFLPPAWQANPDDPRDIADRVIKVLGHYDKSRNKARRAACAKVRQCNSEFWRSIRHLLNGAAPCKT